METVQFYNNKFAAKEWRSSIEHLSRHGELVLEKDGLDFILDEKVLKHPQVKEWISS